MSLYTWVAAHDCAECEHMRKRQKKKTDPFAGKTHVQYRHSCNATLRVMDMKTALCFMRGRKKGKENGTLLSEVQKDIENKVYHRVSYSLTEHEGIHC